MKTKKQPRRRGTIPDDAVLLIPEPEKEDDPPAYGVKPGYYNPQQMVDLLSEHKGNSEAIRFIADMLETGNPEDDGFASMLRTHCNNPLEIQRIIEICKS